MSARAATQRLRASRWTFCDYRRPTLAGSECARLGKRCHAHLGVPVPPGARFIVNGRSGAELSADVDVRSFGFANGVTLLAKFDGEFASHSSTYGGTGTFGW